MIYGFDQNRVFIAGVPYPLPLILLPFYLPPFPYPFRRWHLRKAGQGFLVGGVCCGGFFVLTDQMSSCHVADMCPVHWFPVVFVSYRILPLNPSEAVKKRII